MTFHSDFDPFAVSQHNAGLLKEVSKRRVEKRLRGKRRSRSGHISALRGMLKR